MAERINQHLNPLVGSNIRRLRKERGMKATEVIAKLQCESVNVTTGIFIFHCIVVMLLIFKQIRYCKYCISVIELA